MESKLVKLKNDFNDMINIRSIVKNVFDTLQIKINKLRQIYSEFIENNKNGMFVFGLDSFHFQNKLIDIEYDDMMRLFLAINNRMYCEYFKLHKIIVEYIIKNISDKKVHDLVTTNNYPIYKDLEPFKEYKFELILDIHENILNMLSIIISILNNKENELLIHKTKQKIGLNIDNFITTFNFNNSVMREKILMFITYIEFFHKMHSKYLKRFSNKIQLMYTHISNDIKFDDSTEISKDKKKQLMDDLITNNMDKELIKEFKISMGSETNSDVDDESLDNSCNNSVVGLYEMSNYIDNISDENTDNKIIYLTGNNNENKSETIVNKYKNILQLYKTKNFEFKNNKVNDENEIDKIFYGINKSCDSIINENRNNLNIMEQGFLINKDVAKIKEQNIEAISELNFEIIEESVTIVEEPVTSPVEEPVTTHVEESVEESNN